MNEFCPRRAFTSVCSFTYHSLREQAHQWPHRKSQYLNPATRLPVKWRLQSVISGRDFLRIPVSYGFCHFPQSPRLGAEKLPPTCGERLDFFEVVEYGFRCFRNNGKLKCPLCSKEATLHFCGTFLEKQFGTCFVQVDIPLFVGIIHFVAEFGRPPTHAISQGSHHKLIVGVPPPKNIKYIDADEHLDEDSATVPSVKLEAAKQQDSTATQQSTRRSAESDTEIADDETTDETSLESDDDDEIPPNGPNGTPALRSKQKVVERAKRDYNLRVERLNQQRQLQQHQQPPRENNTHTNENSSFTMTVELQVPPMPNFGGGCV